MIAATGLLVEGAIVAALPAVHVVMGDRAAAARPAVDLVVLSAPLIAAVLVAARFCSDGLRDAAGVRRFSWIDLVAGLGLGLALRALIELIAPTVGGLGGQWGPPEPITTAVLIVGAVLVTPIVEELFFRGLLQRAIGDLLAGAGPLISGLVAVLPSTAAFAGMHLITVRAEVPIGLLTGTVTVGLGCGILTLATRRIGGAIVAHVVFNAIGVALLIW